MANTLAETLLPEVVLDVFSKTRAGSGPLSRWLGFAPNRFDPDKVEVGGPNTKSGDLRYTIIRIFNQVRTVMQHRVPGLGPANVPENPVGQNTVTCGRFHEEVPLLYEKLGNLSPIIGPNSDVDTMGEDYIAKQTLTMAQRGNHTIELMAAGMLRGGFFITLTSGDRQYPVLAQPTSGNFLTISSQLPASNTGFLPMPGLPAGQTNCITGSIDNPNTPFLTEVASVKQGFATLTGYALTDVWMNSLEWMKVITNNQVRATAGSAETPFLSFERGITGFSDQYDKLEPNDYSMQLRGDPTINYHATDYVLTTGGDVDPIQNAAGQTSLAAYDPVVPNGRMIFTTTPSMLWTWMYFGGEPIVENPGMPAVLRRGWYTWHEYTTRPSQIVLISLLNAVPVLENPYVVAFGQTSLF